MVKAALDISLYQRAIASVLPIEGEVAERSQRAASGAIAIAAIQTILLIDCCQGLRTGQLHQFVFEARDTAGPFWPVYLRNVPASDQFGPIALRFQALRQCLNVGLQVRGILFGRDVLAPTGSGLVQVIPAGAEQGRIQAPLQLPKPVLLVSSCFVGYPPQGGWLLGLRSDRVRQKFPV